MNASNEVIAALKAGRKIEAVKLLREERGIGLKEAKDQADAIEAQMRQDGQLPQKQAGGCGASAIMLFAGVTGAATWAMQSLLG